MQITDLHVSAFGVCHNLELEQLGSNVTVIYGPNEAGKTTLMRMLTGFLAPSAGRAVIAGFDVREQRIEASKRLGYLPESGPLYPDMTPLELLRFFGEARELSPGTLKRRIDAVVEICALEQVLEKSIGKLSRGYKQRVGMAQALLHDPEVLILDEPTSGLDPNQVAQVRDLIQDLAKNKTILLSTHILREVQAICDRVILINAGRIVFDGPITDLGNNPDAMEAEFRELTTSDD